MSYPRRVAEPPAEGPQFLLRAVLTGWLVALTAGTILTGLLTLALLTTSLSEVYLPHLINGLGFISILLGSMMAARRARSLGWLHGCLTGLLFIVAGYGISLLFFAPVPPLGTPRLLFAALAGGIGGVLGVNM